MRLRQIESLHNDMKRNCKEIRKEIPKLRGILPSASTALCHLKSLYLLSVVLIKTFYFEHYYDWFFYLYDAYHISYGTIFLFLCRNVYWWKNTNIIYIEQAGASQNKGHLSVIWQRPMPNYISLKNYKKYTVALYSSNQSHIL